MACLSVVLCYLAFLSKHLIDESSNDYAGMDAVRNKQQASVEHIKAPFLIELKPMEIRTFNITVDYL